MFVIFIGNLGFCSLIGYRTLACLHVIIRLWTFLGFFGQNFQDLYPGNRNLAVNKILLLSALSGSKLM